VSTFNRDGLPPEELARIRRIHRAILTALEGGPKTNAELADIGLDYTRAVRAARQDGITIGCVDVEGQKGVHLYEIKTEPEPEWLVTADVTLADGTVTRQVVYCRAASQGQAKNRAQHLFTKVKLIDVESCPW
jgi:hypothetical protein